MPFSDDNNHPKDQFKRSGFGSNRGSGSGQNTQYQNQDGKNSRRFQGPSHLSNKNFKHKRHKNKNNANQASTHLFGFRKEASKLLQTEQGHFHNSQYSDSSARRTGSQTTLNFKNKSASVNQNLSLDQSFSNPNYIPINPKLDRIQDTTQPKSPNRIEYAEIDESNSFYTDNDQSNDDHDLFPGFHETLPSQDFFRAIPQPTQQITIASISIRTLDDPASIKQHQPTPQIISFKSNSQQKPDRPVAKTIPKFPKSWNNSEASDLDLSPLASSHNSSEILQPVNQTPNRNTFRSITYPSGSDKQLTSFIQTPNTRKNTPASVTTPATSQQQQPEPLSAPASQPKPQTKRQQPPKGFISSRRAVTRPISKDHANRGDNDEVEVICEQWRGNADTSSHSVTSFNSRNNAVTWKPCSQQKWANKNETQDRQKAKLNNLSGAAQRTTDFSIVGNGVYLWNYTFYLYFFYLREQMLTISHVDHEMSSTIVEFEKNDKGKRPEEEYKALHSFFNPQHSDDQPTGTKRTKLTEAKNEPGKACYAGTKLAEAPLEPTNEEYRSVPKSNTDTNESRQRDRPAPSFKKTSSLHDDKNPNKYSSNELETSTKKSKTGTKRSVSEASSSAFLNAQKAALDTVNTSLTKSNKKLAKPPSASRKSSIYEDDYDTSEHKLKRTTKRQQPDTLENDKGDFLEQDSEDLSIIDVEQQYQENGFTSRIPPKDRDHPLEISSKEAEVYVVSKKNKMLGTKKNLTELDSITKPKHNSAVGLVTRKSQQETETRPKPEKKKNQAAAQSSRRPSLLVGNGETADFQKTSTPQKHKPTEDSLGVIVLVDNLEDEENKNFESQTISRQSNKIANQNVADKEEHGYLIVPDDLDDAEILDQLINKPIQTTFEDGLVADTHSRRNSIENRSKQVATETAFKNSMSMSSVEDEEFEKTKVVVPDSTNQTPQDLDFSFYNLLVNSGFTKYGSSDVNSIYEYIKQRATRSDDEEARAQDNPKPLDNIVFDFKQNDTEPRSRPLSKTNSLLVDFFSEILYNDMRLPLMFLGKQGSNHLHDSTGIEYEQVYFGKNLNKREQQIAETELELMKQVVDTERTFPGFDKDVTVEYDMDEQDTEFLKLVNEKRQKYYESAKHRLSQDDEPQSLDHTKDKSTGRKQKGVPSSSVHVTKHEFMVAMTLLEIAVSNLEQRIPPKFETELKHDELDTDKTRYFIELCEKLNPGLDFQAFKAWKSHVAEGDFDGLQTDFFLKNAWHKTGHGECSVCTKPGCDDTNRLVYCGGCNMCVHQDCYGIPFVPKGKWLCEKCVDIRRQKMMCNEQRQLDELEAYRHNDHKAVPKSRSEDEMFHKGKTSGIDQKPENALEYSCIFCPNQGGALKKTKDGRWAHLACALWIPQLGVEDSCSMEPIIGMEDLDAACQQVCSICFNKTTVHESEEPTPMSPASSPPYSPSDTTTQPNWFSRFNKASTPFPHGVSVQCSNLKCNRFFHVTCAIRARLYMEICRETGPHASESVNRSSSKGTKIKAETDERALKTRRERWKKESTFADMSNYKKSKNDAFIATLLCDKHCPKWHDCADTLKQATDFYEKQPSKVVQNEETRESFELTRNSSFHQPRSKNRSDNGSDDGSRISTRKNHDSTTFADTKNQESDDISETESLLESQDELYLRKRHILENKWKTFNGTMLVPHCVVTHVVLGLYHFDIPDCLGFVEELARYWSLKREYYGCEYLIPSIANKNPSPLLWDLVPDETLKIKTQPSLETQVEDNQKVQDMGVQSELIDLSRYSMVSPVINLETAIKGIQDTDLLLERYTQLSHYLESLLGFAEKINSFQHEKLDRIDVCIEHWNGLLESVQSGIIVPCWGWFLQANSKYGYLGTFPEDNNGNTSHIPSTTKSQKLSTRNPSEWIENVPALKDMVAKFLEINKNVAGSEYKRVEELEKELWASLEQYQFVVEHLRCVTLNEMQLVIQAAYKDDYYSDSNEEKLDKLTEPRDGAHTYTTATADSEPFCEELSLARREYTAKIKCLDSRIKFVIRLKRLMKTVFEQARIDEKRILKQALPALKGASLSLVWDLGSSLPTPQQLPHPVANTTTKRGPVVDTAETRKKQKLD